MRKYVLESRFLRLKSNQSRPRRTADRLNLLGSRGSLGSSGLKLGGRPEILFSLYANREHPKIRNENVLLRTDRSELFLNRGGISRRLKWHKRMESRVPRAADTSLLFFVGRLDAAKILIKNLERRLLDNLPSENCVVCDAGVHVLLTAKRGCEVRNLGI